MMKNIFLKLMFHILKIYITFPMMTVFVWKRLVAKLHDKEYFIHIKSSKQALNHWLVLKKVHRIIRFNQKTWLKPYIYMNIDIGKRTRLSIRKYQNQTIIPQFFFRKFISSRNKKTQIHMNKPIYLGLSIL